MTEKRKKPEQPAEVWQRLYEEFVDSIQSFQPLDKAEAWLSYVADNIDCFGDQEALVYLRSRGRDCAAQINKLVSYWKTAARRSIERCAEGRSVHNLETGETKKVGGMSIAEASDIKNLSPYRLWNFWGGHDSQELTIDATMLRTVDWCAIGGFDEWWERLAKTVAEDIIQGGMDPTPGSHWLFSMCRSDYAIQLMERALSRSLEAIELSSIHNQKFPWRVFCERETWTYVDHLPYAATIVFASARLRRDEWHSALVHQALETLQKHQDNNGAWRCWADDRQPYVEATAMALHAITIGRPRGWERVAELAKDWLWSAQDRSGCWQEPGCPDSVYLTVLVLDALELASGGSRVTFSLSKRETDRHQPSILPSPEKSNDHPQFKVALSFPGEVRSFVEPIADALAERLGRDEVFYDKYYEAELARPNLDVYLQSIYHDNSELVVVFLCADYNKKEWCGLEWRAIRDLIKKRKGEDVMLLRLDETVIPGLFSIDGYIDLRNRQTEEVVDLICQRTKP